MFSNSLIAQLSDYSNFLSLITDHTGGFLGEGLSFADFNDDGIDDLTFAHFNGQIKFYQGDGVGFNEVFFNITNYNNESKSVIWVDFDNDGDQDLFITNRIASNFLWRNIGGMVFEDITNTCGINTSISSKSYGASFGDYDNDGFVDLYVCNYHTSIDNQENELYHNNGDGTFTDVTASSGVGNGFKQSFQSTWIDIDKDGLLDLHVVNDRIDYLNSFYKNNGDGTFFDMAAVWGVDIGIYAMCSSFGDYDRDGDMDLMVSNGYTGSVLFQNNLNLTGNFSVVTSAVGVSVNAICWGASWFDHDNNSWPDLYVATGTSSYSDYPSIISSFGVSNNSFFTNDGTTPLTDESLNTPVSNQLAFSLATGDFNNDGFPDIVSNNLGTYASVLAGIPNSNNWIKIRPEGTTSNKNAVGAEVEVWHSTTQGALFSDNKVVFCGDNYLSQNSRDLHFGLGLSVQVDSVVVTWPGGVSETFLNLGINQTVVLVEGMSGTVSVITGCVYFEACNFNPSATLDDGSCDFTCLACPDPVMFCGTNTIWDVATQTCKPLNLCPSDINQDGIISSLDLLVLLSQFGSFCQ